MSSARDHDWFCEGIAEEILNALTKLPSLRVATRTSAFRFKDPARDLPGFSTFFVATDPSLRPGGCANGSLNSPSILGQPGPSCQFEISPTP